MLYVRRTLCAFVGLLIVTAGPAFAQNPTGTISGRVTDSSGLPTPGVTVTAQSPNLQGFRTSVTTANGDYIFTQLPPGTYTLTFELSGFATAKHVLDVAPTQVQPLNVALAPGGVTEQVTVTARAEAMTQTAQAATTLKQDFIATLPTNRGLDSVIMLAPSIHQSGPGGNFTVNGSMSFENNIMVNGVNVQDNIRGTANNLYIEDALQETTVSDAGVSAEYGRFSGGVVNVITKSGGNTMSGSYRQSFFNDKWRTVTPFIDPATSLNADKKIDSTIPTYEFTLGGPIVRDRLWYFGDARLQDRNTGNQLAITKTPFTQGNNEKRFEAPKLTYSVNSNHTVKGSFEKIFNEQSGNNFNNLAMDVASLTTRKLPQDLLSLNYSGILTGSFFVEAQYSARHFTFDGDGSLFTDRIKGTLVIDNARGNRYWSPTFCGVCTPEKRDNEEILVKGRYFRSTANAGSHSTVFGYDEFNDKRLANNHQSGSDYRILGTTSIIRGTDIFPQFLPNTTTIQYNPIPVNSLGTNFRTHSVFFNDNWQANKHFSFNLGVRWDKNHGVDAFGQLVARDSYFSPRLSVVYDPKGDGVWAVTGSFAKYVPAIANGIADSSSPAGSPANIRWTYLGPAINPDPTVATLTGTADALQTVFSWFDANGGLGRAPQSQSVPGVDTKILGSLKSPHTNEVAAGVSRQLGSRGAVRVDYVFRDGKDFYADQVDTTTGQVTNSLGKPFDLNYIVNTNVLMRRYQGLSTQLSYRVGDRLNVGGNYTVSHLWGNVDGENTGSGPITAAALAYPEYRQASWNYPVGDLAADQRHRVRVFGDYRFLERFGTMSVSGIEQAASGVPYGAVGSVNPGPFVANPGYITPPSNAAPVTYYFTARDAFHTEPTYRFDAALNYAYKLGPSKHRAEIFAQALVLNLFNQFQLCGCGAAIQNNGGAVDITTLNTGVRSNINDPTFAAFNPFTTTPVQGAGQNWLPDPRANSLFGTAKTRFAFTSPRTFRVSFGVRF
jgi:outer membrane receptor protein involved in Fe transport